MHILIAEDNDINQELAVSLLGQTGALVRVVDDGADAVRAVAETAFDVVLMDIQMPGLNGVEATRRIRALPGLPQPVILAVTANALSGDRERYLQAGMDHYLSKPIDAAELFRVLAGLHQDTAVPAVAPAVVAGDAYDACMARLREAGVGVDIAIERLTGNRSLYIRLAQRFANERQDWPDQLEAAMRNHADGGAAALLHSGKSLAGMLGLAGLQERMARLEELITSQQFDEQLAEEVCDRFREAIGLFRQCLASV
jgi:CheY-like chemotaxis protein